MSGKGKETTELGLLVLKLVPTEFERLREMLGKVLASSQRCEAELADIRRRLAVPVPLPSSRFERGLTPRGDPVLSVMTRPAAAGQNLLAPEAPKLRAIHTHAGRAASVRVRAARARLGLTQDAFGRRLGIGGVMVGFIENGKNGISVRVDAALRHLEGLR